LTRTLPKETASFVITDQLIRAATSVGANIIEGSAASSKKDFINFYNHSLKSSVESKFWLKMLVDSGLITESKVSRLLNEVEELSKILGSIISKSKGKSRK
jgi:four helix bundle protein